MYKDLTVYRKSYQFILDIYEVTRKFPRTEVFGVISQMRRAAASIPVNIAEGSTRNSKKEYHQFICIAKGSATELEVWLQLSADLGYITKANYDSLSISLDEISRMLTGLIKSIKIQL